MAIYENPEQEAAQRAREKEEIAVLERQQRMTWEHEKEMLRIKLVEGRRVESKKGRGKQIEHVLITLIKLPTLIILSVLIPVIVMAGREVPTFLQKYLDV